MWDSRCLPIHVYIRIVHISLSTGAKHIYVYTCKTQNIAESSGIQKAESAAAAGGAPGAGGKIIM